MEQIFLHDFKGKTENEIFNSFELSSEKREGIKILFASYTYISYSGKAFLIVEKEKKLYEINASHCSCYGLENQFNMEETSIELLRYRLDNVKEFGLLYDGHNEFREDLIDFLKELENENTKLITVTFEIKKIVNFDVIFTVKKEMMGMAMEPVKRTLFYNAFVKEVEDNLNIKTQKVIINGMAKGEQLKSMLLQKIELNNEINNFAHENLTKVTKE